jgi:hypothetical protein
LALFRFLAFELLHLSAELPLLGDGFGGDHGVRSRPRFNWPNVDTLAKLFAVYGQAAKSCLLKGVVFIEVYRPGISGGAGLLTIPRRAYSMPTQEKKFLKNICDRAKPFQKYQPSAGPMDASRKVIIVEILIIFQKKGRESHVKQWQVRRRFAFIHQSIAACRCHTLPTRHALEAKTVTCRTPVLVGCRIVASCNEVFEPSGLGGDSLCRGGGSSFEANCLVWLDRLLE